MTTQALFQMKFLDSVMKESQRMNPGNLGEFYSILSLLYPYQLKASLLVRFVRYVDKSVTLKDGTYLPAGSTIQSNHVAILRDPKQTLK